MRVESMMTKQRGQARLPDLEPMRKVSTNLSGWEGGLAPAALSSWIQLSLQLNVAM